MTRLHGQSVFIVLIALLYLPSNVIAVGPPTVLTFDDVAAPGNNPVPMPASYGGVSWPNNMGVWSFLQDSNFLPQSPPNRVLFNLNGEASIGESLVTFIGGPTIFDGAYFSGYGDVQFKLYNGASLVGTSNVLNLGGPVPPVFLASGYNGPVDKVGIVGARGFLTMDNFTLENIPEPSTLLLLGIGAISLRGYREAKSHG